MKGADELTPYAVTARYPGIDSPVSKPAALKAVKTAARVQQVIRQTLENEGLELPEVLDI